MSFKKNVGGISFAGRHFDSKSLLASLQDAISFPNPFMQVAGRYIVSKSLHASFVKCLTDHFF
jgi:hypothetical protein